MFNPMKSILSRPVFRIAGVFMLAVMIIMISFTLTLPSIVSTDWFMGVVLSSVNENLSLPVSAKDINWQWKKGITVSGITIENDPLYSDQPMFFLESAKLRVNYGDIFSGRISTVFLVDNIRIILIQDKSGKMNFESLFPVAPTDDLNENETGKGTASSLDALDFSLSLPVDVKCDVQFDNISVLLINQRDNQKLSLKSGTLALSMPSMFFQPVNLRVSGNLQLNDGDMLPFNFHTLIENRQTSLKTYTLADTSLTIQGDMPGVDLFVNGNLTDKGIKGSVNIDLNPIADIAAPFLPENMSSSTFSGNIDLAFEAAMQTDHKATMTTRILVDRVLVSGPVVQNRQLVPFNASLSLTGNFSLDTGDLEIQHSAIHILENAHIEFKGRVDGLMGEAPDADFSIGPILIDMKEINNYIKPLMPDDMGFQYELNHGRPLFGLDQLRFLGNPLTGSGKVNLTGLSISVPGVYIQSNDTEIAASQINLTILDAETGLKAFFPKQAGITMTFEMDRMDVNGPSPVHLDKTQFPEIKMIASEIQSAPQALFGVIARISLSQSMKLAQAKVMNLLSIEEVSQTLNFECRLLNEEKVYIKIRNLDASMANMVIDHPSIGRIITNAGMALKVPEIIVYHIAPVSADIHNADIAVTLGDLVRLNMTANVKNLAASDSTAKGRVLIDLGNLLKYLPENVSKGLTLSGLCSVNWDIQGRMPYPDEMDKLAAGGFPDFKKDLTFIDHIDTKIDITDTKLDINLSETEKASIRHLSAKPLAHYVFKNGNGALNTLIKVGEIKAVPGVTFHTPVSAEIQVSAAHDGLNSVTVSQKVGSEELNLETFFSVELSEIKRILDKHPQNPIPVLLRTAGVDIQGKIQLADCSVINRFQNDIMVNGALDLDMSLILVPGESISAGLVSGIHHISFNMENLVTLKDLHGNLNLSKTYHISRPRKTVLDVGEQGVGMRSDLLSLQVMQSGRSRRHSRQPNLVLHTESMMETRFNPDHTLMISSVKSNAGPVPVALSGFLADIGLNKGLPELKRFQVDLLDGTIAGAAAVFQQKELFYTYTKINFTGIDLAAFYPEQDTGDNTRDTEIGGRLTLYLPVSTQLNTFLENLDMDLFFSHIGVRALERFFYALDPYENNEAIVTQRRILKTGSPRFIRVNIKDGHLSMVGEINVKGAKMKPIEIQPINITNLSGFNTLEGVLDVLAPVIEMLRVVSSGTVLVGGDTLEFE